MSVTDRWNLIIYRRQSPVYDLIFDRLLFARARRQSLRALAVRSGERVLLPGVGTGADLPLLRLQGDAQQLPMADGAADAAVLHLVLSVVPDGRACAAETAGPSPLRRLLNRAAVRLGTDLMRRLGDLLAGSGLAVVADAPAMLGGAYRIVRLVRGRA